MLIDAVPRIVGEARRMIFMGRGSDRFVEELCALHPHVRSLVSSSGALPSQALAEHMAACDLLVQPYQDGVSARRGSVTAALALGIPVVTVSGESTEAEWHASGALRLVPAAGGADALVAGVEALCNDPATRSEFRVRSRHFYAEFFAIEHTVARLRSRVD
jgi:glycosyltransferase involved in cell wall biosynthesis